MKYKLYHIPGKKIGVTLDLKHRVETQQGYKPGEYEVLMESDDIVLISDMELKLQAIHDYPVDQTPYKNLNCNKPTMKVNVTEQTITFPVPLNKLKGRLMDNLGMEIATPLYNHSLTPELVTWIQDNAVTSQFNSERCFVYNKAMSNFDKSNDTVNNMSGTIYAKIRQWAKVKGILSSGDTKTQYIKLMEEAGELAEGLLKKDKPEIKDAIGDMVVVLTNLASLEGLFIEDCIESAYDEIKDRAGVMENGTFVKFNTKTLN